MLASAAATYMSASVRAAATEFNPRATITPRATLFQMADGDPSQKMAMLVCSGVRAEPVFAPNALTSS